MPEMKIDSINRPETDLSVRQIPVGDLFAVVDDAERDGEPRIYMRIKSGRGRGGDLRGVDLSTGELAVFSQEIIVEPATVLTFSVSIGHAKYHIPKAES